MREVVQAGHLLQRDGAAEAPTAPTVCRTRQEVLRVLSCARLRGVPNCPRSPLATAARSSPSGQRWFYLMPLAKIWAKYTVPSGCRVTPIPTESNTYGSIIFAR